MKDEVYHQYAQTLNAGHWWVAHRRAIFANWLKEQGVHADRSRSVLEIGSGSGVEHDFLSEYGPVTGIELSPVGVGYCRDRGYAELLHEDLNASNLGREKYDLAVDFHVLTHAWVHDPSAALKRMGESLRPGGRLLLTEPAFEFLRRSHDAVVMAERRWDKRALLEMIRAAGFVVERHSAFLSLIAPGAVTLALVDRFRSSHGDDIRELHPTSPRVEKVVRWLLAGERALIKRRPLPFGTCWAVLARKA